MTRQAKNTWCTNIRKGHKTIKKMSRKHNKDLSRKHKKGFIRKTQKKTCQENTKQDLSRKQNIVHPSNHNCLTVTYIY